MRPVGERARVEPDSVRCVKRARHPTQDMPHGPERGRHRRAQRGAAQRPAVHADDALVDAATLIGRGERQFERALDVAAGRGDRGPRGAVVAEHDRERQELRAGQPALLARAEEVAARADPQRVGVVRLDDDSVAAEVDRLRPEVGPRRADGLPGAGVAGVDDERRHRPCLGARQAGAVGEGEAGDRRVRRGVEPEDAGADARGGVDAATAQPLRAFLPPRGALLLEPAVGRADDVTGPEGAGEVGTADEDVGARMGAAGRGGERRGDEDKGEEWLVHGLLRRWASRIRPLRATGSARAALADRSADGGKSIV